MAKETKILKAKNHDGIIDQITSQLFKLDRLSDNDKIVIEQAAKLRKNSKEKTLKACYDFVWKTVPYCNDPNGQEHITTPKALLEGKKNCEDCESQVLLLSSLLRKNGIKTRYKTIAWKKPGKAISDNRYSHIILEANVDGNWITLDPTMKRAGFGKSVPKHLIQRTNIIEAPMESLKMVTLSDKGGCNCGGSLADEIIKKTGCGKCSGKCGGKCGSKKLPFNSGNFGSPKININIGNDLAQKLNSTNNEQSGTYKPPVKTEKQEARRPAPTVIDQKSKSEAKQFGVPYYDLVTGGKTYRYYEV